MRKFLLVLILLPPVVVQADVIHRIQFCAGKFCAQSAPLTIGQQLEINQQFEEGNLLASPSIVTNNQSKLADNNQQAPSNIVVTSRNSLFKTAQQME